MMDREREKLRTYQRKRWTEMLKTSKRAAVPDEIDLETECLIWTGGKQTNGYGQCSYKNKKHATHRVSYEIAQDLQKIPSHNEQGERFEIRHLCNVPLCMEPSHLVLGTPGENGKDKTLNPNATAKGEKHYNTNMTEELATKIKHSRTTADVYQTQPERAKQFSVPLSVVRDIDAGTTWAHIPNSDGVIDLTKSEDMRAKKKARRDYLKTKPWTEEEWTEAEKKLNDPEYTRRHPTKSHDGVQCLEWIKYVEGGYGRMSINGQRLKAHIVACTIGNNYVRPAGLEAAHKCGFSKCVEKTHLYFATAEQNSLDKVAHNTRTTKLTQDEVLEIREKTKSGAVSYSQLSKEYNISIAQISRIKNNKLWTHLSSDNSSASKTENK